MTDKSVDWEVSAIHDFQLHEKAESLVRDAMAKLEERYPAVPRIDCQLIDRLRRIESAVPDHGMIVAYVAQWLSAKRSSQSATEFPDAVRRMQKIAEDVVTAQAQIEQAANAFLYEVLKEEDRRLVGDAYMVAGLLKDAIPILDAARSICGRMSTHLPQDARGSAGVVGALRERKPNQALAVHLATLWVNYGLSLDGGEGRRRSRRHPWSALGVHNSEKDAGLYPTSLGNMNKRP